MRLSEPPSQSNQSFGAWCCACAGGQQQHCNTSKSRQREGRGLLGTVPTENYSKMNCTSEHRPFETNLDHFVGVYLCSCLQGAPLTDPPGKAFTAGEAGSAGSPDLADPKTGWMQRSLLHRVLTKVVCRLRA